MVSTVMRERGDVVVKGELKTLLEQSQLGLLFEVLNNVATRRRREV